MSGSRKMPVFFIKSYFLSLVHKGEKRSTIRLGKRNIATGPLTLLAGRESLKVYVTAVTFKTVSELTAEDARADGFHSLEALKTALCTFYPTLKETDCVTVIHFNSNAQE